MKKISTHFAKLMTLLALAGFSTAAMAEVKVTIDEFEIHKNEVKTVAIQIQNNESDQIATFGGDIYLSEGLEFVAFDDDEFITIDKTSTGRWTNKHDFAATVRKDIEGNPLRFYIMALSDGKYLKGTEGDVLKFQVKATEDIPENGATIELKDATAGKEAVSATAKIINADRAIIFASADDLEIAPGDTKTISLSLNNSVALTALQGTIVLPEGLAIVPNDDDELFTLADRTASHMLDGKAVEGGYMFQLFSMKNKDFKGNEGVILTFDVVADESLAEESEITISGLVGVAANTKKFELDDVTFVVTNTVATRIAPVSFENAQYFSITGQKLSAPIEGQINLVKYADGSVKKVFVK